MIQITNEYAIKANNVCFMICKKKKKKGKLIWETEWYYTSLDHVFHKLINLAVAEGIEKGSWEAVAKEVSDTKDFIKDKMEILTSIKIGVTASGEDGGATI